MYFTYDIYKSVLCREWNIKGQNLWDILFRVLWFRDCVWKQEELGFFRRTITHMKNSFEDDVCLSVCFCGKGRACIVCVIISFSMAFSSIGIGATLWALACIWLYWSTRPIEIIVIAHVVRPYVCPHLSKSSKTKWKQFSLLAKLWLRPSGSLDLLSELSRAFEVVMLR